MTPSPILRDNSKAKRFVHDGMGYPPTRFADTLRSPMYMKPYGTPNGKIGEGLFVSRCDSLPAGRQGSSQRNKIKKSKLIRLLLFSLFLVGILVIPATAQAGWFSIQSVAADAIGYIFYFASYIAGFITGILVVLGTFLAGWVFDLNLNILNEPYRYVVVTGWTALRDLANLGFVLVIIVIALATILRYKEYGVQKLLPRLIAAAILINFSLSLAGVVIDFSNTATGFFLSRVGNRTPWGFASSIAGTLQPQKFLAAQEEPMLPTDQPGILDATLSGIVSLVFTVVFSLVTALAMFTFAFMLLARYLYLVFLLITLPLVILFWVVPLFRNLWNKWLDYFIRWVFFAPAASFFMYLAILVSSRYREEAERSLATGGTAVSLSGIDESIKSAISNGTVGIIIVGLMIGGLIVAQKMGIVGASAAMGAARGAGKGARKWVKNRAARGYQQAAQTKAGLATARKLKTFGGKIGGGFKAGSINPWKVGLKEAAKNTARKGANLLTGATLLRAPFAAMGAVGKSIEKTAGGETIPPQSLAASVLGGMKEGSGLFGKSKEAAMTEELKRRADELQAKGDQITDAEQEELKALLTIIEQREKKARA